MDRDPRTELVVGIFVLIGLALFIGAFFMLGAENPLFSSSYKLHCSFANISGLREGASVRVAGMHAGTVTSVAFPDDLEAKEVLVELQIQKDMQERIRKDSVATIATEGLLGDKYISISVGSQAEDMLEDGDEIDRLNPEGLSDLVAQGKRILANVEDATVSINEILEGPEGEKAGVALLDIFQTLREVVTELKEGKGLIHELIYDKTSAYQYKQTMAQLDRTTERLERITMEIEVGHGTVHNLIYEDQASAMIDSITGAADEIDGLVEDIKTREGLLHTIVYDEGEKNLLLNLTEASANLREVTRMIRDGEGTIGALITDPTIYEDLQTLLGRAERNKILKDYVRTNIRKHEEEEGLHQEEAGE